MSHPCLYRSGGSHRVQRSIPKSVNFVEPQSSAIACSPTGVQTAPRAVVRLRPRHASQQQSKERSSAVMTRFTDTSELWGTTRLRVAKFLGTPEPQSFVEHRARLILERIDIILKTEWDEVSISCTMQYSPMQYPPTSPRDSRQKNRGIDVMFAKQDSIFYNSYLHSGKPDWFSRKLDCACMRGNRRNSRLPFFASDVTIVQYALAAQCNHTDNAEALVSRLKARQLSPNDILEWLPPVPPAYIVRLSITNRETCSSLGLDQRSKTDWTLLSASELALALHETPNGTSTRRFLEAYETLNRYRRTKRAGEGTLARNIRVEAGYASCGKLRFDVTWNGCERPPIERPGLRYR